MLVKWKGTERCEQQEQCDGTRDTGCWFGHVDCPFVKRLCRPKHIVISCMSREQHHLVGVKENVRFNLEKLNLNLWIWCKSISLLSWTLVPELVNLVQQYNLLWWWRLLHNGFRHDWQRRDNTHCNEEPWKQWHLNLACAKPFSILATFVILQLKSIATNRIGISLHFFVSLCELFCFFIVCTLKLGQSRVSKSSRVWSYLIIIIIFNL